MKFSEITDAVNDLWTFCWPPVLGCLLFYGLWGDLLPTQVHARQSAALALLTLAGRSIQQHREALEPFGLNKLVPFLSLFLVIALLFLVNRILLLCGRFPPHLAFRADLFLWPTLTLKQKLLLFRSFPTAEHFNAAFFAAQGQRISERKLRPGLVLFLKMEMFLKFAAIATEALLLDAVLVHAHLALILLKGVGLMFLWLACWLVVVVGQLFEQQQQAWDDWSATSRALQPGARELLMDPMTAEEAELLAQPMKTRWWTITLMDTDRLSWLRRTFLDKQVSPPVDAEALRTAWNTTQTSPRAPGASKGQTAPVAAPDVHD